MEKSRTKKCATDKETWSESVHCRDIPKKQMNIIIMNYLTVMGHKDAALSFAKESGTQLPMDIRTIEDRIRIRHEVIDGRIDKAVQHLEKSHPYLLRNDAGLSFQLKKQQLIELIRNGNSQNALEFARDELAGHGETNETHLREIEKVISLLVFEDPRDSPAAELLTMKQRVLTADAVNEAILANQKQGKGGKIGKD